MSSQLTMEIDGAAANSRTLPSRTAWVAMAAGALAMGLLIFYSLTHEADGHGGGHEHAPGWWGLGILPFVGVLGAIAVLPLLTSTHHWWESNLNRLTVSLVCSALTLLYALSIGGLGFKGVLTLLEHALIIDYIPFIILLFSLYVISGGIAARGDLPARPAINTAFLAVGAGIASFIGTTGASMLLIRPLLKTNSERRHVVHTIVFFIFLVSNIGGTLLPIGDPPLFLGYLRGVDFFWTLGLWPQWGLCCVILLVMYYVWDSIVYRRELPMDLKRDETHREKLRLHGYINIIWLAGVVAAVAFVVPGKPLPLVKFEAFPFMRELIMLALVVVSLKTTPRGVREVNKFNYAAILEVAALFVGIFVCMQIPLEVLRAYGPAITETLNEGWHFYWITGALSSFLDNAPTYLVFFELAQTLETEGEEMVPLAGEAEIAARLLTAISLGAVFMGAMTYIGNGPNFMVKAIAEQSGVSMPSFFGFMFKYSIPILVPVFVLITLIFLK
ncbi:MAG: sodium:proton antiporter [Planctomycetota bacterium]|jgi:Na+/H+ antiporter NhaD/arsenite permease-like protein